MSAERYEPTTRDYERQAEATRHRLADTLDELHDRLTPGHMLDEVLTYARGGGAGFMRALGNAARENPIPALLIGAGCAMFLAEKTGMTQRMTSKRIRRAPVRTRPGHGRRMAGCGGARSLRGRTNRQHGDGSGVYAGGGRQDKAVAVGSAVSGAAASVRDKASDAAAALGDTASSIGDKVSDATGALSDAATSTAQRVRETLDDGTDKVSDAVDQIKQGAARAGETVQDYSAAAADAGRQFKDRAKSLMSEQPLLVAAMGVALGAVIAAALPKSKIEDELMGEASDAVKGTLVEVASDQYDKANTAAATVAGHAMTKAKDEGLCPEAAADASRRAGDKVKRVATAALGPSASALDA